jgi:hypothetical protein
MMIGLVRGLADVYMRPALLWDSILHLFLENRDTNRNADTISHIASLWSRDRANILFSTTKPFVWVNKNEHFSLLHTQGIKSGELYEYLLTPSPWRITSSDFYCQLCQVCFSPAALLLNACSSIESSQAPLLSDHFSIISSIVTFRWSLLMYASCLSLLRVVAAIRWIFSNSSKPHQIFEIVNVDAGAESRFNGTPTEPEK